MSFGKRTKTNNRLRQFPKLKTCVAGVTLDGRLNDPAVKRYTPYRVTNQSRAIGTKLMRSQAWAPKSNTKVRLRGLPYILPSGHLSGSVLLTWKCTAYQWFATVVRKVIERISKRSIVKRRSRYKTQRHLTEIALYYVLTNDDSKLERLLCCRKEGFRALIYRLIQRLDEPTRFCFDQALQSALWFELRGYPRVQSNKQDYTVETVYEPGVHGRSRQIQTRCNSLCDPWIIDGLHYTRGMCFLAS